MGKVKTAIIRGNNVRKCPFGLDIPTACENAGQSINRMSPVDENSKNNENIVRANKLVYAYHKDCSQCPFADKILKDYKKVDCNFGDTAEGKKSPELVGSPLYPQTFNAGGLYSVHSMPLGYGENQAARNIFFGLFSFLGRKIEKTITKIADQYDECGEQEKADKLDSLLGKLRSIKEEFKDVFDQIQEQVEKKRLEYEENRDDSGKMWKTIEKWFGPRQSVR